jgi:hypothetical protein
MQQQALYTQHTCVIDVLREDIAVRAGLQAGEPACTAACLVFSRNDHG